MPQTFSWNGFEASLISPLTDTGTTIALDTAVGLRAPGYLVIEPESSTKREYIYFGSINGSSLENVTRGLDGSIAGGVIHDANTKIRAVSMHQMFDDIWDAIGGYSQDLSNHEADAGDPHAPAGYMKQASANSVYLQLSGSVPMSGPITMGNNQVKNMADGTADTDAVSKLQMETYVGTPFDGKHTSLTDKPGTDHTSVGRASGDRLVADGAGGMTWATSSGGGLTDHQDLQNRGTNDAHSQYALDSRVDGLESRIASLESSPPSHDHSGADITTGAVAVARISDLPASKTTSGTFTAARIPALDTSKITSGVFNILRIPTIPASKVSAGQFGGGNFTFPNSLTVLDDLGVGDNMNVNGNLNLTGIPNGAGSHDLRWNSSGGLVSYA